MSYIFLQEQGGVSSVGCFSDIPASVLSRLNLTAKKSCFNGNGTESCQSSQSGMMLERLMEKIGEEKLMLCAEDSHARTSHAEIQMRKELKGKEVVYGPKWEESLAKYDQELCLWKTHQCSFFEEFPECLAIWPHWGMTVNGECFGLLWSDFNTTDSEFSFMPTITKTQILEVDSPILNGQVREAGSGYVEKTAKSGNSGAATWCLWMFVRDLLPTPKAAEHFMDWPMGWTDMQPLAMDKFQQWLNSHGTPFNEA